MAPVLSGNTGIPNPNGLAICWVVTIDRQQERSGGDGSGIDKFTVSYSKPSTMNIPLFKKWHAEGLITDTSLRRAETSEDRGLFSLFVELRFLLYLGVLLLTGGLGILVYKNIDTIGHQAVLAFIALVTAGCFAYCFRKKEPFRWVKVEAPNSFFDYVLLLGCLSLLIFLGYLQYQYDVFGDRYGLATFIPMVILFATAYTFDHLGVLSLAITNLAAWAGIALTPLTILKAGNWSDPRLIYTGMLLGAILLVWARLSWQRGYKAHFELTYTNFGLHLFFIAALTGLFTFDNIYLFWFAGLTLIGWFCFRQAMRRRSFYFVLVVLAYMYIGLSYVVIEGLDHISRRLDGFMISLYYFIFSAIGMGLLLVYLNRQLRSDDRL